MDLARVTLTVFAWESGLKSCSRKNREIHKNNKFEGDIRIMSLIFNKFVTLLLH